MSNKPLALITGASRKLGIGSTIAIELAKAGWNIAVSYWTKYDKSMPWGINEKDIEFLKNEVTRNGGKFYAIEADLSYSESPKKIFNEVEKN